MSYLEFGIGLGSGLAIAGLLYLALWWAARRTRSARAPSALPGSDATGAEEGRYDLKPICVIPTVAAVEPVPPVSAPPPAVLDQSPGEGSLRGIDDRRIDRAVEPKGRPGATEVIRLSQRVILHLYAQGILPAGAVAPPGLCQAGIGEALGVTQSGLVAALRRLEAAGILTAERGHVRGRDRRLKVYRLSERGLELARELRARAARRPTTSSAVPPREPLPPHPRGVPAEIGVVGSLHPVD